MASKRGQAGHGAQRTEPGGELSGAQLLESWRDAGVEPGMHLIVHSSLSSLGSVGGGAATVVDSLRDAVTETGTLVVPAFTPQVADPAPTDCGVPGADVQARRGSVPTFSSDLPSAMGAVAEAVPARGAAQPASSSVRGCGWFTGAGDRR